jgi:membrane protease YdiL (CAAX protease family)
MVQNAAILAHKLTDNQVRPLTWPALLGLFGVPSLLNYLACQVAIPYLDQLQIMPIEAAYFLSVGLLVLMPMFFGAIYLSGHEIGSFRWKDLMTRMRIKRLSRTDVYWTVAAFVLLSLASFLIAKVLMPLWGISSTPFFFQNMPLQSHHLWILYVWPLYFFFNIFGEEFLWRGYIQPRQEGLTGKWTWLVHGIFWAIWHVPMGLDLVLTAVPIFLILPAVVQIRQNTSIAIVVHAVFGGLGFLALAFGAVQ